MQLAYFRDLNLEDIDGHIVLLDIDGTLVTDGMIDLESAEETKLRELAAKNKVYLCSNKRDLKRNNSVADRQGVPSINSPYLKPSRKILKHIEDVDPGKLIVIGDKFLIDGVFARNIGARFIKVQRLVKEKESFLTRIAYAIDDTAFAISRLWNT